MRPAASPSSSIPIAALISSRGTTPPASTFRPLDDSPSEPPTSIAASSSGGSGAVLLVNERPIRTIPAISMARPRRSEIVGPNRSVTRPPAITASGVAIIQAPWNRPISPVLRPPWSIPATIAMLVSQSAIQESVLMPSARR